MEQKINIFGPRQELGTALLEAKDVYLKEHKTDGRGGWRLWHKALILFPVFCLLYYLLLFTEISSFWKGVYCVFLAADIAAIGFCVMHDANHGSFSNKPWVNTLMSLSLNFLGAICFFWKGKHNIDHHTYTNVSPLDHDVEAPLLRMHPSQPWHWYHRFQVLYCWILYSGLYVAWVLINDFKKYISFTITDIRNRKKEKPLMPMQEHIIFWITKIWFMIVFVYIPWSVLGWSLFWKGAAIVFLTTGFLISIVFQLAHVVQKTAQYSIKQAFTSHDEWLKHQLKTTADFATKSKVLNWFMGGLGFQVEHHLFPKVSHIHYPALRERVKMVCDSFEKGLHKEYRTFLGALWDHTVYMYRLGWDKSLRTLS